MPITPANNFTVKTLTTSQLTSVVAGSLTSNDFIQISQYDSGVYYSRKSSLTEVANFLGKINANYTGSFEITKSKFLSGITGSISLATSAGTFGDDNFLPIKINGTTYKIPLYPNS
jgi:hypothetical protein